MQKAALRTAGCLFLFVALLHAVRAFARITVFVGQTPIPVSLSWIGAATLFLLAAWMFIASKR